MAMDDDAVMRRELGGRWIDRRFDRAVERMASLYGRVSMEAYGVSFDVLVTTLEVDPVRFAQAVMTARRAGKAIADVDFHL